MSTTAPGISRPRRTLRVFSMERSMPSLLALFLGLAALVVYRLALRLYFPLYPALLLDYPELRDIFATQETPLTWRLVALFAAACAALCFVSSLAGLIRRRVGLAMVRAACWTGYVLFLVYAALVFGATGLVENSGFRDIGGVDVNAVQVFYWRWTLLQWPLCAVLAVALLHVQTWRRAVIRLYGGTVTDRPAAGDRILENLRTHGRDARFRKSTWGSAWTHLLVIVIIPILLRLGGCIDPYRPPFGGGEPVVHVVQQVQKKKEKKREFILSTDSWIVFRAPDLDDSELLEDVEEDTRLTYVADPNAAHGDRLGHGADKTPGWEEGFKDGIVRFIRLEHGGPNWDDGMDDISRADINFLDRFRKMSGGMKTAFKSESHPVRLLARYPRGQAPPFVYMTGSGDIRLSNRDIEILREFLLNGSLLFADAGSGRFHDSFRALARRLFPGNDLRVIADDDPIFQIPFSFPHGAPPLWHHGGRSALGVKVKNRWVIFYHPGDVNDAWKENHSGMDPRLAQRAYQLGVNVVYYSFMRYFEETRKYRK